MFTHNVGLGDVVQYGLGKLGIHQKPGCPCPKRQAWLNRMTPGYRRTRAVATGVRIAARALVSLPSGPLRTGHVRENIRVSYPGKTVGGLYPFSAYRTISGAASCDGGTSDGSYSNTLSLKNTAATSNNGKTVCLPAGSFTWNTDDPATTFQLGTAWVNLQGAGKPFNAGSGQGVANPTLLTNKIRGAFDLINVFPSPLGSIRIEGIGFISGDCPTNVAAQNLMCPWTGGNVYVHIRLKGGGGIPPVIAQNSFRLYVDANRVNSNALYAETNMGVISGNDFTGIPATAGDQNSNCYNSAAVLRQKMTGSNSAWLTTHKMGLEGDPLGNQNVYLESNYIDHVFEATDVSDNGRLVVRNNHFINCNSGGHGPDTACVGLRHKEVYDNFFDYSSQLWTQCAQTALPNGRAANVSAFTTFRGGTGVIWRNTYDLIPNIGYGDKTEVILFLEPPTRHSGPYNCWPDVNGYPVPHTTGWGYITGARGPFNRSPAAVSAGDCTGGVADNVFMDSDPLYIWANTFNAGASLAPQGGGEVCTGNTLPLSAYILAGRDYIVSGAARPNWTQYTYPHPLLGPAAPTPPAAPSNLRVSA